MKQMKPRKTTWLIRWMLALSGLAAVGLLGYSGYKTRSSRDPFAHLPTTLVARTNLESIISAPGEVDSSEKTVIECEIESVDFRNGGASLSASGRSMIIELAPEGTLVKQDDVICRLNSVEYEEMARQQEIELEEDRAEMQGAQLDLERLEVSLKEYRDGQFVQLQEQLMGQITLARADNERQKERVTWSKRMLDIGYLPLSRFAAEQTSLLQTEITLSRSRLAYNNLLAYTAPKMILTIEGQLDGARAQLSYHQTRVRHDEEQLALYRDQVAKCTIRAPHDGFLIYANDDDDEERIELGTMVREDQDLFYLPNLERMEVRTLLNETVLRHVEQGMPAVVRIESLPNVVLEGEVVSVSPLPLSIRSRYQTDEVKNYEARVTLNVVPRGLMPGMTAQVQIQTSYRPNSLVVPPTSVEMVDGEEFCYVISGSRIEKRAIKVGDATNPQLLEVTAGLEEGERILIEPRSVTRAEGVEIVETASIVEPLPEAATESVVTLVDEVQPAL